MSNTGMGAVGARRAVPGSFPRPPFRHSREGGNPVSCGNDSKGIDMGAQASRLRMETQASFCAEPSGGVAESVRHVDSASRFASRGMTE